MAKFTNQAQLSYRDRMITSNIAVGEITEDLAISKTAVSDTYGPSTDRVTYVVSVNNNSTTQEFTNLTVTDDMGETEIDGTVIYPLKYIDGSIKYYIDGVLQTNIPTVTAGPPLTISGVTIEPNSNVLLVYDSQITEYAPLGTDAEIKNTVRIDQTNFVAVSAEETIYSADEADLSISKSISPIPVPDSGTLTYTFLIENRGNSEITADDNVQVLDLLNPPLRNLKVNLDGVEWTEGNQFTYEDNSFTTTKGAITVPAATYRQDPDTGIWTIEPAIRKLVLTGELA